MKNDLFYIQHILGSIQRIEEDIKEGKDTFFDSHIMQDAVLRNLQTLAESTRHISETAKEKHPEIQWKSISGFRNILVHDYLGIDMEVIWGIVQRDIPELKKAVEKIKKELA